MSSWNWKSLVATLPFLGFAPVLFSVSATSQSDPEEKSKRAVEAIRKIGGRVRVAKDGLEVDLGVLASRKAIQGLVYLKELQKLKSLSLHYARVKDIQLQQLEGLNSLEILNLGGTLITDEGLAHLKGLTNLRGLNLRGTRVTHRGMATVANFSKLEWLELLGQELRGQVGDEGLVHLKKLKNLKSLYAPNSSFTEEGMAILGDFPVLEYLTLDGNKVGDAGVAHLTRLRALKQVGLDHCGITDRGLAFLEKCQRLEKLDVTGNEITQEAIRLFKKKLPKITIHF